MRFDVSALQAENREHQEVNQALQTRLQHEQQSQNSSGGTSGGTSSNDISALTEAISCFSTIKQRLNAKIDWIASKMDSTGSTRTAPTADSSAAPDQPPVTSYLVYKVTLPITMLTSMTEKD